MAQTQPQTLHASMKPGLKYREIGLNTPLENTGNTPIKIEFKSFILRFNGVEYYKRDTSTNKKGIYPPIILYPKQKIPHSYGGLTFDAKSTSLTSPEINNLNVTAEFEIHYKDLNYDQIKIIYRTVKFILTDVSIAVIYTNIDDTIPE
ncbi:MAG: hypothetical protein ABIN91_20455 [Mucilaginibacter sp.]|uniref:hypothetical protein n=1 Tax=Mucilaginibacter sp. TaxID=1882438 RepID=UPI00326666D0